MTATKKLTHKRLPLLQLAEKLGNVSPQGLPNEKIVSQQVLCEQVMNFQSNIRPVSGC